jgi:hypothetical protein
VTFTRAPFRHWADAFFFLLDEVVRAVVATPRFLKPPEFLEGGVVIVGVASVMANVMASSTAVLGSVAKVWYHQEFRLGLVFLLRCHPTAGLLWHLPITSIPTTSFKIP